jgi:hypothetical protein
VEYDKGYSEKDIYNADNSNVKDVSENKRKEKRPANSQTQFTVTFNCTRAI